MTSARSGFTMLTTLWVMSIASIAAAAAALNGRIAVNAARNRIAVERANWRARACMARLRAAVDEQLLSASSLADAADRWTRIDRDVERSFDPVCTILLEAAGTRLDVNAASHEGLLRLLNSNGYGGQADSLADAIDDWRDSDDVALPSGAERDWYAANGRRLPPNAPLADIGELRLVRGLEVDTLAPQLLSTDPGRVSLANAPVSVLVAIPGISREAAEQIVASRDAQHVVPDLAALVSLLSPAAADSLDARYSDAVRLTTVSPDAWLATVRASDGHPPVAAALRIRLVLAGDRAIVARAWSAP